MKGFGTDEKTLIRVLATKDPLQIEALKDAYARHIGRNLQKDLESETRSWLEKGLVALMRGPLQHDVHLLREAISGPGTNEDVLNDVLLGRSNADLQAIKSMYQREFGRSLEADVKGDLSMKTEQHFMIVLGASRAEDSAPVVPQAVEQEAQELYRATEGKVGTDEILDCSILSTRSDAQIRAISSAYERNFRRRLEDVIRKVSFSRWVGGGRTTAGDLPEVGSTRGDVCSLPPPPSFDYTYMFADLMCACTGIQRSHGRRPVVPTTQCAE